ncbi:hypothetical protein RFI_26265, partial [Reticulomyxa filosa]
NPQTTSFFKSKIVKMSMDEPGKAEEKKTPGSTEGSNFEVTAYVLKDQLEITCRDLITKRLFTGKNWYEQITFAKGYPLIEQGEGRKREIANKFQFEFFLYVCRYTSSDMELEPSKVSSIFNKGDQLVIIIEHDTGLFTANYALALKEVEQSEIDLVNEMLKDMRLQIIKLQTQVQELTKKNERKKRGGKSVGNWIVAGIFARKQSFVNYFFKESFFFSSSFYFAF